MMEEVGLNSDPIQSIRLVMNFPFELNYLGKLTDMEMSNYLRLTAYQNLLWFQIPPFFSLTLSLSPIIDRIAPEIVFKSPLN